MSGKKFNGKVAIVTGSSQGWLHSSCHLEGFWEIAAQKNYAKFTVKHFW